MGTTSPDIPAPRALDPGIGDPAQVRTHDAVPITDPVQHRALPVRMLLPVDQESWPIVVFSHGSLCSAGQYERITASWAARGYAVLMPVHLDALENPPASEPPDLQKLLSSRIRDLSCTLDALPELADAAGAPDVFDAGRIAAAGHSFGALTALIKVGLALRPGEYRLDGSPADARFSAAISMSGVGPLPPMADDAFARLNAPLLVTGGTLDEGNVGAGPVFPWEWRMSAYSQAPAGDKFSLALENADHYLGGLIARDDRGGDADPEGVSILAAVTAAFLDAYVKKNPSAIDWLATIDLKGLTNGRARFAAK